MVTSSVDSTAALVALLDLAQDLPHLGRGLLGLVGQRLDLAGHHGEALAVLAGPAGLDGGVERQQVGLLGHVVDGGDDLADGLGLLGQRQDVLRRRLHLLLDLRQRRDRVLDRLPARLADLQGALHGVAEPLARCAACSEVCVTSSTVATVSATAAACSCAPAACCVVLARISALDDVNCPTARGCRRAGLRGDAAFGSMVVQKLPIGVDASPIPPVVAARTAMVTARRRRCVRRPATGVDACAAMPRRSTAAPWRSPRR